MNDSMLELREKWRSGRLTAAEYREHMHRHHGRLFEYSELLAKSEIACIELTEGRVAFVSREGLRFTFDPEDRRSAPIEALNFGSYERDDAEMFRDLLNDGQTVLDVGAHIGWYSLHIARKYPASRVHAFEPVPASYAILERNVARNELDNVALHPYGLSDQSTEAKFFVDPAMPTAASSAKLTSGDDVRTVTVKMRRLDELILTPDVVKIDVEGAELFVLRGATRTMAQNRPAIFCEMLRKWTAAHGTHPDETIELMHDLGYECCHASDSGLRRIVKMSDETQATNFLFLHTVRHADMLREAS